MRNRDFVAKAETRLQVQKTYKFFLGGKFVRGENGRVLPARGQDGTHLANYCRASRKDFRDAVAAARGAFANWSKQSAYLRGRYVRRDLDAKAWRTAAAENPIGSSTPWK